MEFEGKIVNEIKNENRTSMNSLFFIPVILFYYY